MWRIDIGGLVVAALVAGGGCGNPDAPNVSGSTEEAAVKGTVSVHGKPVTNGEISFRSFNINRPDAPLKTAKIGKDGTYTIQALIGDNVVEVSCKEITSPKNRDLMDNEQPVMIRSGEQTLDIELPSTGPIAPK